MNRNVILPDRFLGDEHTIQSLAQLNWGIRLDPSYNSVVTIYRVLGLEDSPVLAALLGLTVGCVPYILVLMRLKGRVPGLKNVVVLVSGILLTAIYMGTYSKEIFLVPIVCFLILTRSRWTTSIIVLTGMLVYAGQFRNYWYVTAVIFTVLMVLRRLGAKPRLLYISAILAVAAASIIIYTYMGVPADHFRTSVNLYREAANDANTLIPRYVSAGEPLSGIANNLLGYLFLQFPAPLMLKFSFYYVIIALILASAWIVFYRSYNVIGRHTSRSNYSRHAAARAALFILAFAATQALFEPDYGSALKHLTPLIPLVLWLSVMRFDLDQQATDVGAKEQ